MLGIHLENAHPWSLKGGERHRKAKTPLQFYLYQRYWKNNVASMVEGAWAFQLGCCLALPCFALSLFTLMSLSDTEYLQWHGTLWSISFHFREFSQKVLSLIMALCYMKFGLYIHSLDTGISRQVVRNSKVWRHRGHLEKILKRRLGSRE